MQPIADARQEGIKDDEILSFLGEKFPHLAEPIQQSLQEGFGANEILDHINGAGPTLLNRKSQVGAGDTSQFPEQERGILPSLRRGFGESVSGLATGSPQRVTPEDETFTEGLASLTGSLVGDVPALIAGGVAGSAAGTAVAPGLGTILGGGAGSLALPALIKQTFAEYRDYAKGGGKGTFGDFLGRAGRIGGAGIEGAALGAVTSQASRLLPILKRMPKFKKLLETNLGRKLEEPIAELITFTGAESALEGKLPTPSDIGRNLFAIGGFKLGKAGAAKATEIVTKHTPFEAKAKLSTSEQLKAQRSDIESRFGEEVDQEVPIKEEPAKAPVQADPVDASRKLKSEKLKTQKEFLLDKATDALKVAKNEAPSDQPTITIKVPDDGTFNVINTRKALATFIKRARKDFPTKTPDLAGKPKNRALPSGRLADEGVEYYNPFKARRQSVTGDFGSYGYDGVVFADGHYFIKTDKPPKAKVKDRKVSSEETTNIFKRLSSEPTEPAEFIAEFSPADSSEALAHVTSDGQDYVYRTKPIDAILTKHPTSEPFVSKSDGVLNFKVGDETVGLVAPFANPEISKQLVSDSASNFQSFADRKPVTGAPPPQPKVKAKPKPVPREKPQPKAKVQPKVKAKPKRSQEDQRQLDIVDRELRKREQAAIARKQIKESVQEGISNFAGKANSLLPEKIQKLNQSVVDAFETRKVKKDKAREEKFFDAIAKHSGKKQAELVRSNFKWRKTLESPIDKVDGKDVFLSDENLRDMIYYRQRTGNPNVEGDTLKSISERLPEKAKTIIDDVIDDHFKVWRQRWNDNPATLNKINPREGIEDIYLPGVYKETSKTSYTEAMKKADEFMRKNPDKSLSRQFQTKGPFTNAKVFESYAEALEKAGLEPRYDNIKDLLRYHDELMIRLEANNELMAKIREWQDDGNEKVFVTSKDEAGYEKAKADGWIPFEDKFLRMEFVKKDENGKAIFKPTLAPALVEPTAAKFFQGIFNKEAYKPENKFWKAYDNLSDVLKVARVSLSPFHIIALGESGVGGLGTDFFKGVGPLRNFFSKNWWDKASESLADVDKLAWRAEMGLAFNIPDSSTYKKGQQLFNDIAKDVPGKQSKLKVPFKKVAELVGKNHRWIFEEYQPRLKIATFDTYLEKILDRYAKEGKEITPEVTEKIARDVAQTVNNQFGGQIWETIPGLNDKKFQKWMRRVVAYPDWSLSAIRQATDVITPGVKGELAREYWLRYMSGFLSANYLMRFLYGGFEKDNKEDVLNWNPKKAFKELENKDPNAAFSFPLPDIEMEIAGVTINPGRDDRGRRLYAHVGKQALEIPRYATDTIDALFGKSNPVISSAFKQMMGGSPFKGEMFPVRGKYKAGQFMPWDATRPGTFSRGISRTKEALGEFIPFSFKGLSDKGIASYLASGFGGVPVRKGLSLKASEPYIYDALRNKDIRKLNALRKNLKDNGYKDSQIRNRIRLVKRSWLNNDVLDAFVRDIDKTSP